MREKWKIGAGRRPALFFTRLKFSFACSIKNLGRFHAQNRFSEGFVGGESEISYKLWKNWKCHCFFKNASITFIFGHKFIYDNINILKIIGQYLGSLWRHYDVIPDFHQNRVFGPQLADFKRFWRRNVLLKTIFS